MRKSWIFLLLVLSLAAQGCANYMYQGRFDALDSDGRQREFVLYWSKTDGVLWPAKAGPAVLLTECGIPVTFDQQPEGIVFRGSPGQDAPVDTDEGSAGQVISCGAFIGATQLKTIEDGPVLILIKCKPLTGDFAVQPRRYLQARPEPYRIEVTSTKTWSLFGRTPQAPEVPPCDPPP